MSEFVTYLEEVFDHLGPIQARKMFGGYGIYYQGTMFGLVADDILYLKADTDLAKVFKARGLEAFEYKKGDTIVKMSYYMAPDEVLDDPDEAAIWGKRSYEAALRSRSTHKRKTQLPNR